MSDDHAPAAVQRPIKKDNVAPAGELPFVQIIFAL
jgi:hypothetical protein